MEPQRTSLVTDLRPVDLTGMPASVPGKPREAVVLSGGGANGAYEVGVLKALFAGKCRCVGTIDPELYFGTSIGSYNAAFMVSQWGEFGPAAISNLERTWLESLAGSVGSNGAYRFRGDPAYFLDPAVYVPNPLRPLAELFGDGAFLTWEAIQRAVDLVSRRDESLRERIANLFDFSAFISTEPWDQTIRRTIKFASIRAEEKVRLAVAATNWATGTLRMFENHDMTEQIGPLSIRASSAIPGIFPQVQVGAEPYVDGGVLLNTPLMPALDAGADVLHVIYLDPDIATIPLDALNSTVATTYRMQAISWAALVNRDIDRVERINRGLAAFARIQRGEPLGNAEMESLAKGAIMVLGGTHLRTYRPITIHRYHPREELSSGPLGLLDLERGHIEALIDKGFMDARLHDCVKEKCVLPEVPLDLATLVALQVPVAVSGAGSAAGRR
ncbi:MAG TPA: patatin-like phospholipase family protein [Thermoanaerobaculia bacterium]|nr:patatin-like phospholipase family protein [Thermoanaerobaculia bacterium]